MFTISTNHYLPDITPINPFIIHFKNIYIYNMYKNTCKNTCKKMLQKYSHNSRIIPTNFELSNFKTKKMC